MVPLPQTSEETPTLLRCWRETESMLAEAWLLFPNQCRYVTFTIAMGGRGHPTTFTEEETESQRKIIPSGLGRGGKAEGC